MYFNCFCLFLFCQWECNQCDFNFRRILILLTYLPSMMTFFCRFFFSRRANNIRKEYSLRFRRFGLFIFQLFHNFSMSQSKIKKTRQGYKETDAILWWQLQNSKKKKKPNLLGTNSVFKSIIGISYKKATDSCLDSSKSQNQCRIFYSKFMQWEYNFDDFWMRNRMTCFDFLNVQLKIGCAFNTCMRTGTHEKYEKSELIRMSMTFGTKFLFFSVDVVCEHARSAHKISKKTREK